MKLIFKNSCGIFLIKLIFSFLKKLWQGFLKVMRSNFKVLFILHHGEIYFYLNLSLN